MRNFYWRIFLLMLISFGSSTLAADNFISTGGSDSLPQLVQKKPAKSETWTIGFDNDILAPGGKDQDYTFGASLSYAGKRLDHSIFSSSRDAIDRLFGFTNENSQGNQFELGLYAFTPAEPTSEETRSNDRPYASLVYASSTNQRVNLLEGSVLRTQITIGALGLDLVGDIQNSIHRAIGNEEEQGWHQQISQGGEPTFRYQMSKHRLIAHSQNFEWKTSQSLSLGYITEASLALSLRSGQIRSAWHEFNPEVMNYAENQVRRQGQIKQRFFWAGVAIKLRGYNAFLQGQFKHSDHRLASNELNHLLVEAWAGYTHAFGNGYFLSYGARGHSSEVRTGPANRTVIWGGFTFGRHWQ